MNECIDLIYDRFRIELYPEEAVSCAVNPNLKSKVIAQSDLVVNPDLLFLEIGSFHRHTGRQIATNDTATKVNSKVSEKADDGVYKVKVSFEFTNPDANSISLCNSIDYRPFHIFIRYLGMAGDVISSRYIYNGLGQSSVSVVENQGVVSVDIDVVNVNGIQFIS